MFPTGTQSTRSRHSTPVIETDNTQSTRSRHSTPVIETDITQSTRTRHSTPVIETDIVPLVGTKRSQQQMSGTDDHHTLAPRSNTSNVETDMIAKHSRQIRAIYELQKATFEKISIIQNQVKKLTSSKSTDLSPKVFSVSNFISLYY